MPMQIVGKLNPHGEETYTVAQACGILNLHQTFLYGALKELQMPAIRMSERKRAISVISHSFILKILDMMGTKAWKNSYGDARKQLIVDVFKREAMKSKNPKFDSSVEEIKKLAEKLLSMIGKNYSTIQEV